MPPHLPSYAAAGLSLALLPFTATAQTYSSCNPTNASQFPCSADPGLCQSTAFTSDFTTGSNSSWHALSGTVTYNTSGAVFTIAQRGDAPTLETDFYLFYGRIDVTMRAAPGTGIVSSIVLQSDDLDEIDWEFLGADTATAHSNYFSRGNTTTYDREATHPVSQTTVSHTYTLDWTPTALTWSVDNTTVRTLLASDVGTAYPQTPASLRLGIWAGGDADNGYWTRQWAGGDTTYSADAGMPWSMVVEGVRVVNYYPAESYNYTDTSGDSDSIGLIGSAACSAGNGTVAAAGNGTAVTTTLGSAAVATGTPTPTPTPSASYTNGGGESVMPVGLGEFLLGVGFVAAVWL